jgi:hypothetical protein
MSAPPRDTFAVAGWLFADLMLALVVVFVASAVPPRPVAEAAPAVTASPTVRTTPTTAAAPTPSPTSCLRTAVLRKNNLKVPGRSGGRPPTDSTILRAFRRFEGQQVGLLLTYGHGVTPAAGAKIAAQVNRLLRVKMPETVTRRTILEDFFNDVGGVGTVTFDVYLLAADCQ